MVDRKSSISHMEEMESHFYPSASHIDTLCATLALTNDPGINYSWLRTDNSFFNCPFKEICSRKNFFVI